MSSYLIGPINRNLYSPSLNVYDALKLKGLVKDHVVIKSKQLLKFLSSTYPVTSHYNHIVMFVMAMVSVRM